VSDVARAIEDAIDAGGVVLEVYRRPGFTGGPAVRRATDGTSLTAMSNDEDREVFEPDIEIICAVRRAR
jgi:hypothetical protein